MPEPLRGCPRLRCHFPVCAPGGFVLERARADRPRAPEGLFPGHHRGAALVVVDPRETGKISRQNESPPVRVTELSGTGEGTREGRCRGTVSTEEPTVFADIDFVSHVHARAVVQQAAALQDDLVGRIPERPLVW